MRVRLSPIVHVSASLACLTISSFDPLVILDAWEKESKDQQQGQEDEETLQTLVSRASTTLKPVGI